MWTISGFADEISSDLREQCALLNELRITHLEFRAAWGTNVADLDIARLTAARRILDEHQIAASSIGSPIGKMAVDGDFAEHVQRFDRCLAAADILGAPYVRVFSFYPPPGGRPADVREQVLSRMAALVARAEGRGVVLLHENEKGIYGDTPARCADLLASIDSAVLRAAWDPANFVQCGVRPFDEGLALLRPWISYVHVKDARAVDGSVVPAGLGDGDLRRTLHALAADGFDGFFSLEPHLAEAAQFGGFSGPELFTVAHTAFTGLLEELGITYA